MGMTTAHATLGRRVAAGVAERRRSRPDRGVGPRVSTLFGAFAIVIGAITLSTIGALSWTATRLRHGTEALARESDHAELVKEVYASLLEHRWRSDLDDGRGAREQTLALARATENARELLAAAALDRDSERESALFAAAARDVAAYRHAREESVALGELTPEAARRSRRLLDRAFGDLSALDDLASESMAQTRADVERVTATAELISLGAALLLFFTMASLGFALQRLVGRPLVALSSTIERFRAGETDARASCVGVRELVETADSFNEMAATLLRHREGQLAYLAGVVHDIRNPLGALKLAVYSLRAPQSTSGSARTLDLVDRQVDRLRRLVDDVLDATRIEVGNLELRREQYDVRHSLREMVELYAPTAQDHQIVLDVPDEPLLIDADPVRMEQVFGNLLSNAIKYSPGNGSVHVRAGREDGGVLVEVQDHGIGIAAADLREVFAPFRRRAPEIAGGAGLGLSVARHIVEAHAGRIEVESALGRGSTFRVWIPAAASGHAAAEGRPEG